jgi:NtrC-family two-component system sensor histidine kinase KinB
MPLRILVVEDSEQDTTLLVGELQRGGYDVVYERVDTAAAMRAALESQSWDLVTSDHAMPQFSAPAALTLLKQLQPNVPFIIVSGEIDSNLAVSLMRAGAQDYIQKQELARLTPAVERELREAEARRERQRAEQALRESESRYKALFDSASDAIAIHDMEGRFLEVNRVLCERLGYSRDELLQMTVMDIEAPEYAALLPQRIQELRRRGRILFDTAHVRRDGCVIPIELSSRIVEYAGALAILSIGRDITERKQAEESLRQQNEYLATLHETALGLMNRLELTAVLENILARATQLLGTPHGYIYLAEPGRTEIENKVGSGIFALPGRPFKPGEGLTGQVWQTGQPLVVDDYDTWPGRLPDAPRNELTAVAGVPLKSGAQVTGVLAMAHVEPGRTFSSREIELLNRFAQLSSIALDNARLYEAAQRELVERKQAEAELRAQKQLFENVVAVARATAERPTLEATLQNVLDVTTKLTGAEYGDLLLLSPSGVVTHYILPPSVAASERRQDLIASMMDKGLAGWVARHRQAALIADTSQDERWLVLPDNLYNVCSALSVPILSGPVLAGILTLTHTQPNRFTEEHLRLLHAAADQMALAVRNAQIFDAQRRMADRQTMLYEVLRTVSRQLDPEHVAWLAVEAIVESTGWSNVSLALPDEERAHWVIRAARGDIAALSGLTLPFNQGVTGRVFETNRMQLVPDVRADPDYVAGHPAIRSELAVPLRRSDHVVGVLNLESDRLAAFDEDDVLLAESLAEVIALALDNARLYEATQRELFERKRADKEIRRLNEDLERRARELAALNKAGQAIASTLDLEAVLRLVIAEVQSLLEAEGVSVLLREGNELVFAATTGPFSAKLIGTRFPATEGIAGNVLQDQRPSLIADVRSDSRFYDRIDTTTGLTTRSLLAVPLIFRGTASGVIEAINKANSTFDEHDLETLEAMAGSAALAIENARLHKVTWNERGRLQALIESSRDGIILGGMNGRILVANTPAVQLLHLPGPPRDWLDRSVGDMLLALRHQAPAVARMALTELRHVKKGDDLINEGEYALPPHAVHWLNLPVQAGDVSLGRLLVLRDVTAERAVEELRADMTRMMVHDLRNPVGTILTALQFLGTEAASVLSNDQRRTLTIAHNGAKRMLALVNSILDVSQLESGQMLLNRALIRLDNLIDETLRAQLPQAVAKNQSLESDLPPALPPAWADAELIGRVLQNLVGNAIKFTPAGGVIRVTARVEQDDKRKLLVSVSDTGRGIPPEIRERLFQKFVRGRQVGRGSGLGLAFCKLAVEAHGERIGVESTPESGATFTFSLATAPGL